MRRIIPLLLALGCMVGLATTAQAQHSGPVDSFDVDVLTAYRYGLNHDWALEHCFGRRDCPEERQPQTAHVRQASPDIFGF